jgi:hypothetical protein
LGGFGPKGLQSNKERADNGQNMLTGANLDDMIPVALLKLNRKAIYEIPLA